jgi:undecaprenyl-diphosphatase
MSILEVIILGIVEGITEFLPISSTGHLILVSSILNLEESISLKTFLIVIQFGAILAVLILYFKSFFNFKTLQKLFVAFLPIGIAGLTIYKFLKEYLLGNIFIVIVTLFIGGVIMIILEKRYIKNNKEKELEKETDIKNVTIKQSFYLGLWQCLSLIPGVSRSGATIIGGLLMGINRELIIKFSFLLAVPTMFVAGTYDLYKNYTYLENSDYQSIAIGFLISFIFAFIFIRWLLSYVRKNNFIIFGWYRILIAVIFALIFF